MPRETLRAKIQQLHETAERLHHEFEELRTRYLAIHNPEMHSRPQNDPQRKEWEHLGDAMAEAETIRSGLLHQAFVLIQLYKERFREEYFHDRSDYFAGNPET
ncbi:MAG: hypothetical protein HY394_03355 [Candidatus Diapherotrites archaeon]|nr:hypothetical protein [Candidatus Diapherotrites archaeon]